jgi:hypothetical protein
MSECFCGNCFIMFDTVHKITRIVKRMLPQLSESLPANSAAIFLLHVAGSDCLAVENGRARTL